MDVLRTPGERFANLPDFPYTPQYIEGLPGYEALRMAYIDEGPRDAEHTFLCLHGEPTWSFLYRKMIPPFLASGARVVAPDHFGFGRSDKPVDDKVYTIDFHRTALLRFIERLDLTRMTLVCQDWGGLLGLTLPMDMPERFARLLVMNTAMPTGEPPIEGFLSWLEFVKQKHDFSVGALMTRAVPGITRQEAAAYDAPFPDARYKAGVRRFPLLVPISPEMDGIALYKRARAFWSNDWSGPTFMAVGALDPVAGPPVMAGLRKIIRGCPEPMVLEEHGHFVQEHGEPVARAALAAFG